MFTQLAQLLKGKTDTFTVTAARESDTELRVVVMPKLAEIHEDDDDTDTSGRSKLNKPLVIVGTPEELDGPDFIGQLTRFAASATGLRQSLDEIEAEQKLAAEEARKNAANKHAHKAAAKAVTKPAPAKPPGDPAKNPLMKRPAAETPQPEAPKSAVEATEAII